MLKIEQKKLSISLLSIKAWIFRPRSLKTREEFAAYALATPAMILLFVLLLGPALAVIILSFTDWQFGAKALNVIGFQNYIEMFNDKIFWISIRNTMIYVLVVVVMTCSLGPMSAGGSTIIRIYFFILKYICFSIIKIYFTININ